MSQTPQQQVTNQRYRQLHKATGLCVNCPNPALPGSYLCGLCYSKNKQYKRLYYLKNREAIQERHRRNHAKRRDDGKCTTCSKPLDPDADDGRLTCVACIQRRRLS